MRNGNPRRTGLKRTEHMLIHMIHHIHVDSRVSLDIYLRRVWWCQIFLDSWITSFWQVPEAFEVFVLILWYEHCCVSSMLQPMIKTRYKADNSWITLRPPWTNCGWIMDLVEGRKAQDYLDDSWGRSPLGRDQRPRLPRISSLVRSQRWLGWSRERGKQTCGINGASRWVQKETVT